MVVVFNLSVPQFLCSLQFYAHYEIVRKFLKFLLRLCANLLFFNLHGFLYIKYILFIYFSYITSKIYSIEVLILISLLKAMFRENIFRYVDTLYVYQTWSS
jgi:hypothetical protein